MGVSICLFGVLFILGNVVIISRGSNVSPGKTTKLMLVKPLESSADHGVIATLKWRAPPSNSTLYFYVRYQEDKSGNPSQKRVTSNTAIIYLKPNTKYFIKVTALDELDLPGPWSDVLSIQTRDSVPTKPPNNVTAVSRDASSILVTWQPIPKQHQNGILLGYIVFYRNSASKKWKRREISSSNKYSYVIKGLSPRESYIIAVAGYTRNGTGKKSVGVKVDRSIPTQKPTTHLPTTSIPIVVTTSADEVTTPTVKSMANDISKPTTQQTMDVTQYVMDVYQETLSSPSIIPHVPPDAQANKDISENKTSSIELVYKFIVPCAVAGLILVLLIVCLMWHQRRTKKKRKHQQEIEAMSLRTLSESKKSPARKDKNSKCEVTRGEGSIRYAPPKSFSTPPQDDSNQEVNITSNQLAELDERRTSLSVISECAGASGKCSALEACKTPTEKVPHPDPGRRRNYSEVSVGNNEKVDNERYVKRGDEPRIYAEPFLIEPTPSSPCKSTSSEAKYENMQHLYEFLDIKDDDKDNPLYMNISEFEDDQKNDGEDLYEEIPAERPESGIEEQPLIDTRKSVDEENKNA